MNRQADPAESAFNRLPAARRRIALAAMLLDTSLLALIFTALPPVLPAIAKQFGGGDRGPFIAQLVMTMPSIGLIAGGLISGWIVTRLGARTTLFAALIAYAVLGSAGLVIDNAPVLLATRLALGVAAVTGSTAVGYLIGMFIDADTRVRFLGYRNGLASVIGFIGTFAAGPLADLVSWRADFAIYLFALAVAALAIAIPAVAASPAQPNATAGSVRAAIPIYAMIVPLFIVVMMNGAQLSFLLAGDGIDSAVIQSRVIGIAGVFSALGSPAYGFIRARLGVHGAFAVTCLALGSGTFIMGLSHDVMAQSVGSLLAGTGCGLISPHFQSLIYDRVGESALSRAIGWLYSFQFFGDFLNPFVLGAITAVIGLHGTFSLAGALVVAAGVVPLMRYVSGVRLAPKS